MGYALFAMRKILLTDRVNNYNLDLMQLSNKKNKLQQLSTAVADGEVSAFDLAQCQEVGLAMSYKMGIDGKLALSKFSKENAAGTLMAKTEAYKQTGGSWLANIGGAAAGAAIGSFAFPVGTIIGAVVGGFVGNKLSNKTKQREDLEDNYKKEFEEAQLANIVEDLAKDIAEMENMIDKQQANIETKLTATQQELQKVQEAEGKAIQNSTPKYGGIQ